MKKKIVDCLMLSLLVVSIIIFGSQVEAKNPSEADWVNNTCEGIKEYMLIDRARVDCLTPQYAFEYDWGSKWAEAIGQSLYYAAMTNKQAGIRLICRSRRCATYLNRLTVAITAADLNIKIEILNQPPFQIRN